MHYSKGKLLLTLKNPSINNYQFDVLVTSVPVIDNEQMKWNFLECECTDMSQTVRLINR